MSVSLLERRESQSAHGVVRYWVSTERDKQKSWLIFLHGMLVDHRLFEAQLAHFAGGYNVLAWDSPAHNASRPYDVGAISVFGAARGLAEIIEAEDIERPILIGQSFGGIVASGVMQLHPKLASGFIGVDTLPLKRTYWPASALHAMRHAEPVLRMRSFERVLANAPKETSCTAHGQRATREMLSVYGKDEYFAIAGRTLRAIAEAVSVELPYDINCPALLICGDADTTAGVRRFNRKWAADERLDLEWIPGAAHNSPLDNPDAVTSAIEHFLRAHGRGA